MRFQSRRVWLAAVLIPPAVVTAGGMGLAAGSAVAPMANSYHAAAATTPDHPTVSMRIRLASNDSGPNNPDSDISGPYDSDKTNIAPKAPSSGTGMACEDQGVACDHDQSGSVLSSDNDEV
ncbi:hypothetical protein [Mycobacteroides abscessus]|uniref:hypothetical protein n=1 Tax=Mycobacteroides abscessus TaxID=36809 RepID=UPI000D9DD0A5|nr:hypothetical protein [Mycobacteroides abscessus]SPX87095.1 Uncharacterised protein [Mycobacteroides abscessus]